jgi:hypothetical protein
LTLNRLHGIISQKIVVLFITTAVTTSNPTIFILLKSTLCISFAEKGFVALFIPQILMVILMEPGNVAWCGMRSKRSLKSLCRVRGCRKAMNNLSRDSRIITCRLRLAVFHYRTDVQSLLPRGWGWGSISVNFSQMLRPSDVKTRSFGKTWRSALNCWYLCLPVSWQTVWLKLCNAKFIFGDVGMH